MEKMMMEEIISLAGAYRSLDGYSISARGITEPGRYCIITRYFGGPSRSSGEARVFVPGTLGSVKEVCDFIADLYHELGQMSRNQYAANENYEEERVFRSRYFQKNDVSIRFELTAPSVTPYNVVFQKANVEE